MDPNYVRDEENEDEIMRGIYEDANRYDPDGEDAGGEDVGGGTDAGGEDDEDFTSQFLCVRASRGPFASIPCLFRSASLGPFSSRYDSAAAVCSSNGSARPGGV